MGVGRSIVASAARIATGTSDAITPQPDTTKVAIAVNVSAASASDTLDLSVEWSDDGGTTWVVAQPADSFTQITAVSSAVKVFDLKGAVYRLRWTIAGTDPSFTFAAWDYGL